MSVPIMNIATNILENYFDSPCQIYLKDKHGKILECNEKQAKIAGFDKGQELVGLYNEDLLPRDVVQSIITNDQETLATQTLKICVESAKFTHANGPNDSMNYCLSYKFPHYTTQGKLIGLMGVSFDIHSYSSIDLNPHSPLLKHFLISPIDHPAIQQLSPKQKICLKHLLQGKTYKEIGEKMHLSHRTIEQYVENLKNIFGCQNKSELISFFNSN